MDKFLSNIQGIKFLILQRFLFNTEDRSKTKISLFLCDLKKTQLFII